MHQAVLDDIVSLDAYDIYIAGPFPMVGVVRDAFLEQGAKREQMFADAFAYIWVTHSLIKQKGRFIKDGPFYLQLKRLYFLYLLNQ